MGTASRRNDVFIACNAINFQMFVRRGPAPPDANQDPGWLAMEKETGIPADQLADPHLHHWSMRAQALLDELKVPEQEREAWLERNTLSPGHFTLEWVLPSPPPVHCFTEPPVVKDSPEDHHPTLQKD